MKKPEPEVQDDVPSPFDLVLERSPLARDLRSLYDSLISTGLVHVRINGWIEVSFCLPQKVHQFHKKGFIIEPETIQKCLQSLRPYHGLLLLVDSAELLDDLPLDASPALVRLIKMYSPLKSLQTLAADTDLTLSQVFQLTGHLLYWAKATVIYPLCENNVYVIAPDAPTSIYSPLVEKFSEHFPGVHLLQIMSDFSLPASIGQKINPLQYSQQHSQLVQMVVWMLQHRLLLQLHTYVYFMPTANGPSGPQERPRSSHGLQPGSTRDGSYQSTPDEQLSVGTANRAASDTSLSSGTSDGAASPRARGRTAAAPQSSSLVSTDNEASLAEDGRRPGAVPEELLAGFSEEERAAVLRIPAATVPEDLRLLVRLDRQGYLRGCHHVEEIMYAENLRRSQLLQLLDKFRDVLITCQTEDPAVAMFYSHSYP
ncbi:GATOR complex protein NPRL3 isoform X2 [Bacillus rossius redtenbacheri]|uniref:GATOR complex protein NPRL3 isoform X2 n=1 Tax=Bacillus rossius redtenbacheri TaxID=93214 RepID=UPI002FDD34AF